MASPERPQPTGSSCPKESDPRTPIEVIDDQLERTDAIENPIERTFKREALLEVKDQLTASRTGPIGGRPISMNSDGRIF